MMQVIEEMERIEIGDVRDSSTKDDIQVFAHIGKNSGKFYGLYLKSTIKDRHISFSQLDQMMKILKDMGASFEIKQSNIPPFDFNTDFSFEKGFVPIQSPKK